MDYIIHGCSYGGLCKNTEMRCIVHRHDLKCTSKQMVYIISLWCFLPKQNSVFKIRFAYFISIFILKKDCKVNVKDNFKENDSSNSSRPNKLRYDLSNEIIN